MSLIVLMRIVPWYIKYPERFERELLELNNSGIAYELDEAIKEYGIIRLHLQVPPRILGPAFNKPLRLNITYPYLYPHFGPQLFMESDSKYYPRLMNVDLCSLPEKTNDWESSQTAASFLTSTFSDFVNSHNGINWPAMKEASVVEEASNRSVEILQQKTMKIMEDTLSYIGRDIHDNLGQIASVIKINLSNISKGSSTTDQLKIQGSIELCNRLINEIRSVSLCLKSDEFRRLGFMEALKNDIKQINTLDKVHIIITEQDGIPKFGYGIELHLYRMTQEIINNTLKHSHARRLNIIFNINREHFVINFIDDGIGFGSDLNTPEHGNGLNDLAHRSKVIGAYLKVNSQVGMGTNIVIMLPLRSNHYFNSVSY